MRILVCPPEYFDVDYVINPWMEGQIGRVDSSRARAQWDALFEDVRKTATVERIDPEPGSPDMCFTANAGLTHAGRVVRIPRILPPSRAGSVSADHGANAPRREIFPCKSDTASARRGEPSGRVVRDAAVTSDHHAVPDHEDVAEHFGLALSQCMAMGDARNDREMLAAAGLGVAMANAHEETKAVADEVMDLNNNESAVATAIERFVL